MKMMRTQTQSSDNKSCVWGSNPQISTNPSRQLHPNLSTQSASSVSDTNRIFNLDNRVPFHQLNQTATPHLSYLPESALLNFPFSPYSQLSNPFPIPHHPDFWTPSPYIPGPNFFLPPNPNLLLPDVLTHFGGRDLASSSFHHHHHSRNHSVYSTDLRMRREFDPSPISVNLPLRSQTNLEENGDPHHQISSSRISLLSAHQFLNYPISNEKHKTTPTATPIGSIDEEQKEKKEKETKTKRMKDEEAESAAEALLDLCQGVVGKFMDDNHDDDVINVDVVSDVQEEDTSDVIKPMTSATGNEKPPKLHFKKAICRKFQPTCPRPRDELVDQPEAKRSKLSSSECDVTTGENGGCDKRPQEEMKMKKENTTMVMTSSSICDVDEVQLKNSKKKSTGNLYRIPSSKIQISSSSESVADVTDLEEEASGDEDIEVDSDDGSDVSEVVKREAVMTSSKPRNFIMNKAKFSLPRRCSLVHSTQSASRDQNDDVIGSTFTAGGFPMRKATFKFGQNLRFKPRAADMDQGDDVTPLLAESREEPSISKVNRRKQRKATSRAVIAEPFVFSTKFCKNRSQALPSPSEEPDVDDVIAEPDDNYESEAESSSSSDEAESCRNRVKSAKKRHYPNLRKKSQKQKQSRKQVMRKSEESSNARAFRCGSICDDDSVPNKTFAPWWYGNNTTQFSPDLKSSFSLSKCFPLIPTLTCGIGHSELVNCGTVADESVLEMDWTIGTDASEIKQRNQREKWKSLTLDMFCIAGSSHK